MRGRVIPRFLSIFSKGLKKYDYGSLEGRAV